MPKVSPSQVAAAKSISVASIEDLLLSASRDFPLVIFYREQVDPDVCWIGKVLSVERGSTDAGGEEEPVVYKLSQITRVSFGADYETALHLVGGDPKQAVKSCPATGDNAPG